VVRHRRTRRWVGMAGLGALAVLGAACGQSSGITPAPQVSGTTTNQAPLTLPTTPPMHSAAGVLAAYRTDFAAGVQAGYDLNPSEEVGNLTGQALEFAQGQITAWKLEGDKVVGPPGAGIVRLKLISLSATKAVVKACINDDGIVEHNGVPVGGYQGQHTWDLLISTMVPDPSGTTWLISSSTGDETPYVAGHPCGA
jgi:hypothetical protein